MMLIIAVVGCFATVGAIAAVKTLMDSGDRVVALTLIAVLGVVALASALVFGIGWANESTTSARARAQVARIEACKALPAAQRAKCVNPPTSPYAALEKALAACQTVDTPAPREQCIAKVVTKMGAR